LRQLKSPDFIQWDLLTKKSFQSLDPVTKKPLNLVIATEICQHQNSLKFISKQTEVPSVPVHTHPYIKGLGVRLLRVHMFFSKLITIHMPCSVTDVCSFIMSCKMYHISEMSEDLTRVYVDWRL
jgi:hypothetical protein